MKLSDFLITQKISFKDGKIVKKNSLQDGEVELYELTKDVINKIKTEVIDKLEVEQDQEKFVYALIPYITNVEVDVDYDVFKAMMGSSNVQFSYLIDSIIDIINNLLELMDKQVEMSQKIEDMIEKHPEVFQKKETLEEIIQRITKEMNTEKDSKKKREMLIELARLYEEFEKQQNE